MTHAAPAPGTRRPPRRLLLTALGAIAAAGLLVRIPSMAEPLSVDQGLLASAATCLSRALLLYRDVFDQKPPGIYLTYLAGFSVFGWTSASVNWLDMLAAAATTILLFLIVKRIGTPLMAAAAAALYSALTVPAWIYKWGGVAERSVAETFIVVCVALAAWCGSRLRERVSRASAFGLGLFAGAAVVYKPNAGLYLPALLLWAVLVPGRRMASRDLARVAAFAVAGAVVLPAVAILWIWRSGAGSDAWVALVDFNRYYVAEGFSAAAFAHAVRVRVGFLVETDPLWAGGVVASLAAVWDFARTRRLAAAPALAVAWGGAAALVIAVNGVRLFQTYFIQALPPLAIAVAWFLTTAAEWRIGRRLAAVATAVLMTWLLASKNYPGKVFTWLAADYEQMRGRLSQAEYLDAFSGYGNGRGWSARANAEVAAYVRARTAPGDLIYQFGVNDSGVYFDADRLPAAKFLRANMFVPASFPAPGFQLASVAATLAARRPVYLIFERFQGPADLEDAINSLPQRPEIVRLLSSYRLDTRIEDFTLYRHIE